MGFVSHKFDQKTKTVSREGAKPQREEVNGFVFFATPRLRVKPLFLKFTNPIRFLVIPHIKYLATELAEVTAFGCLGHGRPAVPIGCCRSPRCVTHV